MVALLSAFGAAWQVQDWRYTSVLERQAALHAEAANQLSQAALRQQQVEQGKRQALEHQLNAQDQQHTRELSDAQRDQARLRDRLATADVRLSVLLDATDSARDCRVPTAPDSVGVVHATRRAQLDPAHAQRIIAITDEGDRGLIALQACQAYVRALTH
ncbi:lysis system i-spanin subunit Rz [Pseudomonas sp. K5002]|uniref:lysis system i-spanin subunit Rz n=1 Tax=Pseudomonas sp. K5002 TaxID=2738828 RepID=UPI0015BEB0B7|nr:lysis system i-spanin subunit Rz [Pseudomonas sp. K5002]NWD88243.1 lysis protein [Pseudomonas sp. K5002]